jgi:hypothetical protein
MVPPQILASLVSGGAAGALISFVVNRWVAAWTRSRLHSKLTLQSPALHSAALSVRVCNGYVIPLTNCWAYLTLHYQLDDIKEPPQGTQAHIHPGAPLIFREDRLCWAAFPDQPPEIDIYAGEKQSLLIGHIDPNHQWIGIFSETCMKPYRVFLRGGAKYYEGTLKIVSKDTTAKEFPITIDLRDPKFPQSLFVQGGSG